jgi:putative FmdB family regulatory protein
MPFYDYACACGYELELLRPVAQRKAPVKCRECGNKMDFKVGAPHFATMKMGVSKDFPTFAAKWDKAQRQKSRSKKADSNNRFASDATLNKAGML